MRTFPTDTATDECIACLNIRTVDADSLCAICSPTSPGMRRALLALLKPAEKPEATS